MYQKFISEKFISEKLKGKKNAKRIIVLSGKM